MFERDRLDKKKIVELTQEKYFELSGKKISHDEALDIIHSLREYSEVLIEIYEENKELFHLKTGITLETSQNKNSEIVNPELREIISQNK